MRPPLALLLLALPALAAAANVEAPRVEMKAWAGPMAQAFVQIGVQGFQAQPYASLTTLATRLSNLPGVQTVEAGQYTRLAGALHAQGLSPEAFKKLGPEQRMTALQTAAGTAEAGAAADLDAVLARMPEKLTAESAGALKPRLEALIAAAPYLTVADRRRLGEAGSRVKRFFREREDAFQAWLKDTPSNIRNGAFDGAGHIVKTEDGWRIAEHAPAEKSYPSYTDAFAARLMEINAMKPGPWRERAMKELRNNIADERVAAQAAAEGANIKKLREAAAAVRLKQYDPGLKADKRTEAGRAIERLGRYDEHMRSLDLPLENKWRQELTLLDGAPEAGYAPYRQLTAERQAIAARAHQGSVRSLAAMLTGFAALIASAPFHPGALVFIPLSALIFGALGFLAFYLARQGALTGSLLKGVPTEVAMTGLESRLARDGDKSTPEGAARFHGRLQTRFGPVAGVIDARYVALKDRPFVSITVDDASVVESLPKKFEGLPVTVHIETGTIERAAREQLGGLPGVAEVRVIHSGEPNMALRVMTDGTPAVLESLPKAFRGLPLVVH